MTRLLKKGQYSYLQADCLGKGSFGKVYKGKITQTEQVVAVKVMDLATLKKFGEDIFQVITTEVSVMIKLSKETKKTNFPYIVKIYDCFRTENNIFMILEYCGEGDLEGLLKVRKSIPEEEAVQIIYQVSQSIQFIASYGIAHRDIKPQNIFIKKQWVRGKERILYKLGDFGFAAQKKTFSTTLGTYPYMAPELFQNNQYNTAVDIWALGVMSHQILFDEIYFIGRDQFEIKKKVLKNPYVLKPEQKQKVSAEMEDFLTGCMKKDPDERLSSNAIAHHKLFQSLENEQKQSNNVSQLEHVNYVIKVIRQNIYKCVLLKMLAVDLKGLVPYSDFGAIFLLKKGKFVLNTILEALKKQKCPFTISNDIWFSFVKSSSLKDAILFANRELQLLDKVFTQFLTQFKVYTSKFPPSDQQKIVSILSAHANSPMFCSVFQKEMERWVQQLCRQKNEKKRVLAAECHIALRMEHLSKYDFETHCRKRPELEIGQIQKWLVGQ